MTCPGVRDNISKGVLIADDVRLMHVSWSKGPAQAGSRREGLAAYQLVGGVTAHRGDDG